LPQHALKSYGNHPGQATALPDGEVRCQRILLIDDDPFVARAVERYLADYGLDYHSAADGEQGIEQARRLQPDLILLDLQMPGLDGFQVCARLKASPLTAEIPVILFTSCNAIEDKIRGFQLGAVDYVTKPVAQNELVARITVHLQQRRLHLNLLRRLGRYEERYGDAEETLEEQSADLPERRLARIAQAKEILERRFATPPTLEQLARAVGTNAKRLSKDFQILHGMTVFAWLREQRLHQAAQLLRTTGLTISEIAERLGFSSGPNLSTLFKSRFQVTPRQYRISQSG
jgi:DNA-binding response OmpR family regulator